MGVKGLWKLIEPTGRNIRLDTLEGSRLAIDSSIWLYQFTQAMRDKTGNTLVNAHILGFLRRILKLLFWGIKPVFVFDGKVPELKKRIIKGRQDRRAGKTSLAERTAQKLLAAQLRQAALKANNKEGSMEAEATTKDYMAAAIADRRARALDPYHLPSPPPVDADLPPGVHRIDPRLATEAELQAIISEMAPADFDITHPAFLALPPEAQYEIIGDLRVRSRQTSHKRLNEMLESSINEMDFSKAQIVGVMQRNKLTQKLINIAEPEPTAEHAPVRIQTERNREYVLIKRGVSEGGGFSIGYRDKLTKPTVVEIPDSDDRSHQLPSSRYDEEEGIEMVPVVMDHLRTLTPDKTLLARQRTEALTAAAARNYAKQHAKTYDPTAFRTRAEQDEEADLNEAIRLSLNKTVEDIEDDFEEVDVTKVDTEASKIPAIPFEGDNLIEETKVNGTRPNDYDSEDDVPVKKAHIFVGAPLAQSLAKPQEPLETSGSLQPLQILQEEVKPARDVDTPKISTTNVIIPSFADYDATVERTPTPEPIQRPAFISNIKPEEFLPVDQAPEIPADALVEPEAEEMLSDVEEILEEPQFTRLDFANESSPPIRASSVVSEKVLDEISPSVSPQDKAEAASDDADSFVWEETPPAESKDNALPEIIRNMDDDDAEEDEEIEAAAAYEQEQEEYVKFAAGLKNQGVLETEQDLADDILNLRKQRAKAVRQAQEIGLEMTSQVQALLRFFGIPYLTAPQEAEAQCAELMRLRLVDGIITDDSDIFLFGGTRVFKNMFNQNQLVKCYNLADIERDLALSRDSLIDLAHILGSDYTEGLIGFGPVKAMQVVHEFRNVTNFAKWWRAVQKGRDGESSNRAFRQRFKKNHKSLYLEEDFPSAKVNMAYFDATVDSSREPFVWGIPDLDALRIFLGESLGWSTKKVDHELLPVIRKRVGRPSVAQTRLDAFFDLSAGLGVQDRSSSKNHSSTRLDRVVKEFRQRRSASEKAAAMEAAAIEEQALTLGAVENELFDQEASAQPKKRQRSTVKRSKKKV